MLFGNGGKVMNGMVAIKALCLQKTLNHNAAVISFVRDNDPIFGHQRVLLLLLAEPSGALRSTRMRSSALHRRDHCDRVHRYSSHSSGPDIAH